MKNNEHPYRQMFAVWIVVAIASILVVCTSGCATLAKYEAPPTLSIPSLSGSIGNNTASGAVSGGMEWGDLSAEVSASFGVAFEGAIDTRVRVDLDLSGLDAWVELTGTVSGAGDSLRVCAQAPMMAAPVCEDVEINPLPDLPAIPEPEPEADDAPEDPTPVDGVP